jgi:hypothetical protein
MGIFVSILRHNSDKKTVTENKIQNNVRQYKIGKFSCDITKYDFWICGILQVFPKIYLSEKGVVYVTILNSTTF